MNRSKLKLLFKNCRAIRARNYWDRSKAPQSVAGIRTIQDGLSLHHYRESFESFEELSLAEQLPYAFTPNQAAGQFLHICTPHREEKWANSGGWGNAAYLKKYNEYYCIEVGKYLVLCLKFKHEWHGKQEVIYFAFQLDEAGNIVFVDFEDKDFDNAVSSELTVLLLTGGGYG